MKHFSIALLLCLGLPLAARAAGVRERTPFDRGIDGPNSLFIPKGTFCGGATITFNSYTAGNGENGFTVLAPLLKDLSGRFNSFGVAPAISYFVSDNTSLGLRFDYDRMNLDLGSLSLSLNDDLGLDINDIGYKRQSYSGAFTVRYYMPIEHSRRFALFVEARLSGTYAQSMNWRMEDGLKHGTYQDIYKAGLGLVPGICVFVMNNVSFDVQIGIMGVSWQKVNQVEDQVRTSTAGSTGANFNINLLSIGFGVNFYILDKWHRP
ncbi:MAG: hypothetical protein IJ795_06145 [Bacteroidales bacterium]|nr:hypothetical protein [Bacteroidales bacterium]